MSVIAKTETFQRDMARTRSTVGKFETSMSRTTTMVTGLSRSFLRLAGVGGGLYMFNSLMRSSVKGSVDFEYEMARVSTMLNAASMKYLPEYRKEIERMSIQYGKAVGDLASGTYEILSRMIPAGKAMEVLETNVRAAKGGFTDTAIAVRASVGLLNSYGYEAERVGNITNIMHKIVNRGAINFEELSQEIGTVASTAAILEVELEALAAVITTITRANVPLSMTFTGIRNIINTLQVPTTEAKLAAKELGFELNVSSIKGAGLITVFEKLSKASETQLKALMPNIRGMGAFAAGLKNATMLGDDYRFMMGDVQAAEQNFAKENATTKARIDETREAWKAAKRSFGDQTIPALTGSLKALNATLNTTGNAMKALKPSGSSGPTADRLYSLNEEHRLSVMEAYRQHLQDAAQSRMAPGHRATQNNWREDLTLLNKIIAAYERSYEVQARIKEDIAKQVTARTQKSAVKRDLAADAMENAVVVEKTNTQILAETREHLASVRAMQDKTRMEKIQIHQDYIDQYIEELNRMPEAEKIVRDEIISITKSRVDAMTIYHAELREDMKNTALYSSEKFAEAFKSIETSASDAFYFMRQKGADWQDAMAGFWQSVGDIAARTTADMAARMVMLQALNLGSAGINLGGSLIGGIGALFMHGGGVAGRDGIIKPVPASAFIGAPRLHKGLAADEYPAILQEGERVTPKGGGQPVINIGTYIEKVEASDAASFDALLYRSRKTLGDLQIMNVRGNHPIGKMQR